MIIKTVQDALDWFNLNKQGYKEDYIAIIKLQALINRTEEPRAIENKDILELQKTINQIGDIKWHLFYLGANTHDKLLKFKPNLILLKNAFAVHSMAYSEHMYDLFINKYNKIQNIKTTPQLLFYKIDIEFFKNIIKIKNSNDTKKINKCKNIIKTLQDAGMKEYSNELKKFIKDNF